MKKKMRRRRGSFRFWPDGAKPAGRPAAKVHAPRGPGRRCAAAPGGRNAAARFGFGPNNEIPCPPITGGAHARGEVGRQTAR